MNKQEAIKHLQENPLDRERWIECGKAMGWACEWANGEKHACVNHMRYDWSDYDWVFYWHRFIDALVSGKTAEEFFKELE